MKCKNTRSRVKILAPEVALVPLCTVARLPDFFCSFMAKFLIKNHQNCCFLENLWPKSQNVLTMAISIFIEVTQIVWKAVYICQKMWFCQISNFLP